jgi:hypothetical protein
MSFFSFLDWIFGGSFFDGFGATTNDNEDKGDGGTTGSGGAGKPPSA